MRRVCGIVRSLGRRPILWDDLAGRGDFPEGAVIQQWHYEGSMDFIQLVKTPEDPAVEAAKAGHDVVVSRYDWHYFDYNGDNPAALGEIYRLDPLPGELGEEEVSRILGLQACLWDTRPEALEERLLPRLKAIAEVAWTDRNNLDWTSFESRLRTGSPTS